MKFISVKERLPVIGEVVDVYIKEGKDIIRVCDVEYLGEFDDKFGKHDKLHVFKYHDVCGWTEEDISDEFTVENDGVIFWSEIILPK